MPATEQTWRNQKLLHRVFAVTGVLILFSTMWMFVDDHNRPWKPYQRKANRVEITMTNWRELQYQTEDQIERHRELMNELEAARMQPLDEGLLAVFESEVKEDPATANFSFDSVRRKVERLEELRGMPEATAVREAVFSELNDIIQRARFREDRLLGQRKFKAADRGKAIADLGLMVRDRKPLAEQEALQAEINTLKAEFNELTRAYEEANAHREKLDALYDELRRDEVEAESAIDENQAELEKLRLANLDRRSTYLTWWGPVPLPGKRWLELPILDAFNSPLQIDNLWSDGLEIDYNFRKVRRFDRCTTCHKLIDKTLPGTADQPAYRSEKLVELALPAPDEDLVEKIQAEAGDPEASLTPADQLERLYGIRLAQEGLLEDDDVTIQLVRPESLAARAEAIVADTAGEAREGAEIARGLLQPNGSSSEADTGMRVGDVVYQINGDPFHDADNTLFRLLDAAFAGESLLVTVRRGLPNPYSSHPRLDLYVGSLSPHKLAEFACTSCHEGQGSATAFKWASHSPNTERERQDWSLEHGWFDNHHWIYPMYPRRFAESACLRCHHQVSELEPSEQFPDPPAPKLMRGYDLVRKYGCYGCHEINGYDGPERIGPDMRLEPNVTAAVQQLATDPGFQKLDEEVRGWARQLVLHPDRDGVRRRLYEALETDSEAESPVLTVTTHRHITPLLADVEHPGTMRKSGPSLRYVAHKADNAFLYDWIREPKNFRPSTRMPQFFGLWDHLDEQGREIAESYEPIEILGIVTYLTRQSQPFSYLPRVEGAEPPSAERGKYLFQTRGCLACHGHDDFQDAEAYRPKHEIVQGPDLSGIGDKLNGEKGLNWLYTWIKQPTKYHARTVMPDLYLDPIDGADGKVTDPAADIAAYLMSSSVDWKPKPDTLTGPSDLAADPDGDGQTGLDALDSLLRAYLGDTFSAAAVEEYAERGIPAAEGSDQRGAEVELIVDEEDSSNPEYKLPAEVKLAYIGRKTIARYGCYACHDIPGFEDAKPIGTGLADWGRKDPSKLAFEHIVEYLEGHGHAAHGAAGHGGDANGGADGTENVGADVAERVNGGSSAGNHDSGTHDSGNHVAGHHGDDADRETREYFEHQIKAGHRAGFIYQKLLEPRSYDYHRTANKKYSERLRMPAFPFTAEDREAVITFVLGLVADPPSSEYVYRSDPRMEALVEGRKVLEKYNCGGCHILEAQEWSLDFIPGDFGPQLSTKVFPFLKTHFTSDEVEESMETNFSGFTRTTVTGMPSIADADGTPIVYDYEGDPILEDELYNPSSLEFPFDLWRPAILNGNTYEVGVLPLNVRAPQVRQKRSTDGGFLAKYLLPYVIANEKKANPNAKGTEAWGWLPPPLLGEGNKVQTEWLYEFLLNPHPIRPSVVLRMPRFNMSSADATALVNYFAAKDNAEYPYDYNPTTQSDHLAATEESYQSAVANDSRTHLGDAMKIVTNKNYCIKCHLVGDYEPAGADVAKAPDLADVYRRLRPSYVRGWIANPKSYLPYTGMPVNIPYDPDSPTLGGVSQDLYHGTSIEQVDALVDLLMNFDDYTNRQTQITALVTGEDPAEGTPPAAESGAATSAAAAAPATTAPPPAAPAPADKPDSPPQPAAKDAAAVTIEELPEMLRDLPPADGWGDLTVQFVYDGEPPVPTPINVTKDKDYCGKFDLVDESLVVNSENRGIANVVAFLYLGRGQDRIPIHESYFGEARKRVVLDNTKCKFEPRVATVWTPQTLEITNSDSVGHNTKVDTFRNSPANNTVPAGGKLEQKFAASERLPAPVSCNIHPWMSAWLVVRENPYFAVSDKDGRLTIKNLPAGEWNMQFWQERAGYVDKVSVGSEAIEWSRGRAPVTIRDGETTNLGVVRLSADLFKDD